MTGARTRGRWWRRWLLAGFVAVAVTSGGLAFWWYAKPKLKTQDSRLEEVDPRLTYPTRYRNVRPEVRYTGDEACTRCHGDIADTYRQHPMGQALTPVAHVAAEQHYDETVHDPFTQFGSEFQVQRRGDHVFHALVRRDAKGQVLAQHESEVQYVLGSGTRGRSYLHEHDGYLFQSPISWFNQKKIWDISPGYTAPLNFNRTITVECLFCHTNDANWVPHSVNRYRSPIFHGYRIGCERCHGPGELHVESRMRGDVVDGIDATIVNPGRLEDPMLRDSVCEQCHLLGEVRVLRRNRQPFDYRPGLPLGLFWSVFVRAPQLAGHHQAVGQVEQMRVSRCSQGSKGALGCISCHDPHVLPAPEKRVAYYRDQCLKCHDGDHALTRRTCIVSLADRQQTNGDSCFACHMPRAKSSDIAHTAVTDHRIQRRPETENVEPTPLRLPPGELPIVPFHAAQVSTPDRERSRDLGLAIIDRLRQLPQLGPQVAPLAGGLLQTAVKTWPDDVPAREGLGYALWAQARPADGLAIWEKLLTEVPEREQSLSDAAGAAESAGRTEEAADYARRAVALNPWRFYYRWQLAKILVLRQEWSAAAEALQEALQLDPTIVDARELLITCYLHCGKKEAARKEFDLLLALNPATQDELRLWFADQEVKVK
jgi:Tfp pilus assembly protein PilF